MVCFVLRPGPPPTGLKPPTINYTSTTTTVATAPIDIVDNESVLPDNAMYDEMMMTNTEFDLQTPPPLESTAAAADDTMTAAPAENDTAGGGGPVKLHGKTSDRGKHRNTWNQANRTVTTNYTVKYNKVSLSLRTENFCLSSAPTTVRP